MTTLAVQGLSVSLDRTPVLRGVTCTAAAGGWLALIGPNGAGKSTLIRAAAGLVAYEGAIRLDGADLRSLRLRDRARLMAYVPQEPVLPPDMTVEQYVLLGPDPAPGLPERPGTARQGAGGGRPGASGRGSVRRAAAGQDVRR